MSTLTKENKIAILEALLATVQLDHPEFQEENSTTWDMIESGKLFIQELESDDDIEAFGFAICDVIDYAENNLFDSPIEITREEAIQILDRMRCKADISIGVSWETLEYFIREFLENKNG